MMIPAVGLLAAGMASDAYVIVRKITEMPDLALAISLVAGLGFALLLYVVPLVARQHGQRHAIRAHG
jgi:hypothetical protein